MNPPHRRLATAACRKSSMSDANRTRPGEDAEMPVFCQRNQQLARPPVLFSAQPGSLAGRER